MPFTRIIKLIIIVIIINVLMPIYQNASEELLKLGGARVILATVPDAKSMSEIVHGLGADGKLLGMQ